MTFLDRLDATRAALADDVQTALGTGAVAADEAARPATQVVGPQGLGLLVRLAALAVVAAFGSVLFAALLPNVSDAIGSDRVALTGLTLAVQVMVVLASVVLVVAAFRRRRPLRVALIVAVAAAIATGAAGLAGTSAGLTLALAVAAVGLAATRVLHPALLVDGYPPAARARALFAHRAADTTGRLLALGLAVSLASLGLSWRGAFVLSGGVALVVTVAVLLSRPRQPAPGGFDTEAVRGLFERPADGIVAHRPLTEELRRALHRPTIRRVLAVWAALGALAIPLLTFGGFFLADRWHVATRGRLGVLAVATALTLPVLALVARRVEVSFASDPGQPLRVVATAAIVAGVGLLVAVISPVFVVALLGLGAAIAAVSIAAPLLDLVALSVAESPARPAVAALAQVSHLAVGGLGGVLVFGGIDRRFGLSGGLVALLIPAALVAWLARRAAPLAGADLERLGDDVVVAEELARHIGHKRPLPLLVCRALDFSYGPLQVLFDVDFTVDEGQLVALLGTNGAGKSTLLRVISGLGIPSRGSVHLRGEDITFHDAESRLRMGVAQVPGGRAVFGPLTVAENLLVVARGGGRNGPAPDLDAVFDAFPRLAERRNQLASTLSGGEQQMLGLSKALLLRPRLLLVDELSLGLAPKVVSELLEMIRRINREGTAVVLVEQSVNVALSIADHAYFMEKGEVRFDGPAAQLLDRRDLVRSVFLGGAAKRLAGAGRSK